MNKIIPKFITVVGFLTLGCILFHGKMLKGGGNLIHGDLGDSRFVNLLLEHSYKWFSASNFTQEFWTAAWNYFPVKNSLLMSEILGAASWNYIFFRASGLDPSLSYQLWFVTTSVCNFLAMYLFARTIGLRFLGSMASAWIFAFGLARVSNINHPQLLPNYYLPLFGVFVLFSVQPSIGRIRRYCAALLSGVLLGLQFWVSFYLVWFAVLGLMILAMFSVSRIIRNKQLKYFFTPLAISISSFVFIAGGLALKYLEIQKQLGARQWRDIVPFLPPLRAWLLPPSGSWIYSTLHVNLRDISPQWSEMLLFPGAFSLIACAFYLLRLAIYRRFNPVALLSLVAASLMIVSQPFAWKVIYYLIPGASAIRAVGRIGLLAAIPFGLIVGYFFDALFARQVFRGSRWSSKTVTLTLLGLLVIDNGVDPETFYEKSVHVSRVDQIISKLNGRSCEAFHYASPDPLWVATEIDAMWASMESEVPTMNGYSGHWPTGYGEDGMKMGIDVREQNVSRWLARNSINSDEIQSCLIR